MIYTLTLNPSIDYTMYLDALDLQKVNVANKTTILAGGKGINVSTVLHNLTNETIALGFVAGFTGNKIVNLLDELQVKHDFVYIDNDSYSRINVKLSYDQESEINGAGPQVEDKHIEELLNKFNHINSDDIVVISGSIPSSLPSDIYQQIINKIAGRCPFVVDARKDLLLNCLSSKPFLIKPNNHELEEIFNCHINSIEDTFFYASKLQTQGARNVLVSLGSKGACLLSENNERYYCNVPKGKLVSSVGSGDSMVAGFISGYLEKQDYQYALIRAIACGSGSAFSQNLVSKEIADQLCQELIQSLDIRAEQL